MKLSITLAAAGAAVALAALATTGVASATTASAAPFAVGKHAVKTCAAPTKTTAACMAQALASSGTSKPAVTGSPSGLNPADIQSAYKLSGSAAGRTVAIVDAYNDPTAESDLAVYRSTFGLPACTTANGCFHKIGSPPTDAGWATEISLDLDMVSAACPSCKIDLVEASSASFAALASAENTAASQPGVVAISNSYGGGDSSNSSAYNHQGIAITASSGDGGYGIESPASYTDVIGVGGTSLTKASNSRGWTESAWSGAGSGCSTINAKPTWQTSVTQCSKDAVADVSAVADPNTGVSVYDTTPYQGSSGWQVYGGTSAASPIIASVYALSGNTAGYPGSYTWAHSSGLFDVTTGSNGSCSPSIWCHAGTGWDGPTGLGTPNGTSAF
ncbi:MAG: peptidase S8 [Actinomycetota bacterium]|nr:peptidase S8 [Actinomycetota bacterium]